MSFWNALDRLLETSEIIIDRPKGCTHPRFPDYVYPLDYGYLSNTASMDGDGVDIWIGTLPERKIVGIICTVDLDKRDSEIKILYACTEDEIALLERDHNATELMKGILIRRS